MTPVDAWLVDSLCIASYVAAWNVAVETSWVGRCAVVLGCESGRVSAWCSEDGWQTALFVVPPACAVLKHQWGMRAERMQVASKVLVAAAAPVMASLVGTGGLIEKCVAPSAAAEEKPGIPFPTGVAQHKIHATCW